MAFFIPSICVKLSQFYSTTSLVLFTINNKLQNKKKEDFFVYVAASVNHVISFLDTHVCIINHIDKVVEL